MANSVLHQTRHDVTLCRECGNQFPSTPEQEPPDPCPGCEAWEQLQQAIRAADPGLLASDAILSDLTSTTKPRAVYEIVCSLAERGYLEERDTEDVAAALLRREELASTGIGHGIAIPHVTHVAVPRSVVALARSRRGIDFESLDNEPVRLIALALSPPSGPGEQLRVLSKIARHLRDFNTELHQPATVPDA
jgi:PTS system fructose-specific IIA component/PTS system nitrogen regulatory IIA component